MCQEGKQQGTVDRTLDSRAFRGWVETDNPWTNDDETDNGNLQYMSWTVCCIVFTVLEFLSYCLSEAGVYWYFQLERI